MHARLFFLQFYSNKNQRVQTHTGPSSGSFRAFITFCTFAVCVCMDCYCYCSIVHAIPKYMLHQQIAPYSIAHKTLYFFLLLLLFKFYCCCFQEKNISAVKIVVGFDFQAQSKLCAAVRSLVAIHIVFIHVTPMKT